MKKNELGFMLAETLIVATFISVILIYLFVQFRNINNNYEKTLKYNGVNEMYILEQVYNYLGNIDLNQMSSNIIYGDKDYYVLSDCEGSVFCDFEESIFYSDLNKIKEQISKSNGESI